MPLDECMRKTTNRHYLAWMEFFSNEWNEPNRSDHYAMQTAQAAGGLKELPKITFAAVKAKTPASEAARRNAESEIAEAMWRARLGMTKGAQRGEMKGDPR